MNVKFFDFDIYSKRIGLFYQNKEKMGTPLGMLLTIIYLIISLGLFTIYTIDIIKHETLNVHDSLVYPREAPNIKLDRSFFYFAFGVETPTERERFIDNTIYYPRVQYFYKVKEGGSLKIQNREELKVEKCDETKFGKDYQSLLVSGELNNSYCVEDINMNLTGGLKYDKLSYILIGIYPCVNTTENKNHCKPQNIIDQHLSGAYFSFLAKDVGLNPSNYSNPVVPTFQDFFTTIDKSFFRDYVLYFGITEIQTDKGIFYEKISSQKVLQIRKEAKAFYFRDESYYYKGDTMCDIVFKLGDDIRIQKRSYNKITRVFSVTGGYMQLISAVFTIITFFSNKLEYEIKLANSLFNFYPQKRKITIRKETLNSAKMRKYSFINNNVNKLDIFHNFRKSIIENNINRSINDSIMEKENKMKNSKKDINIGFTSNISDLKFIKNNNNPKNDINNKSKINIDTLDGKNKSSNNMSKITLLPNQINKMDACSSNINKQFNIIKNIENKQDKYIRDKNMRFRDNYKPKNIKMNMCYYFCFSFFKKDKINIRLFNEGVSFYRQKMDVIHLFNIILLFEATIKG